MNQLDREKYKKAILERYEKTKNKELSLYLSNPTPANIKGRLLEIANNPSLSEGDERIIRLFLGLSKEVSLIKAIQKDTEAYKPIQYFLKRKTTTTTKPGLLDLVALLVNFYPRPLTSKMEYVKEEDQQVSTEKIEPKKETNEELKPKEGEGLNIEKQEEKTKKKNRILLWTATGLVFVTLLLFITTVFLDKGTSKYEVIKLPNQIEPENIKVENAEVDDGYDKIQDELLALKETILRRDSMDLLNRITSTHQYEGQTNEMIANNKKKENKPLDEEITVQLNPEGRTENSIENDKKESRETQSQRSFYDNANRPIFNTKPPYYADQINYGTEQISGLEVIGQGEFISTNPKAKQRKSDTIPGFKENSLSDEWKQNSSSTYGDICFINPNYYSRKIILIHSSRKFQQEVLVGQGGLGTTEKGCLYELPIGVYMCEVYTISSIRLIEKYQVRIKKGLISKKLNMNHYN